MQRSQAAILRAAAALGLAALAGCAAPGAVIRGTVRDPGQVAARPRGAAGQRVPARPQVNLSEAVVYIDRLPAPADRRSAPAFPVPVPARLYSELNGFEPRVVAVAVLAGATVFAPFPFLASVLVLPGLAWLALLGLVVPVALVERCGFRACFRRAIALARADYVHALGSLSALVISSILSATVLFFLLRGQGDAALSVAAFLALLVISPVVLIGSALLYVDQAARVGVSRERRPVRSSSRGR
jgi:hypothetical protein